MTIVRPYGNGLQMPQGNYRLWTILGLLPLHICTIQKSKKSVFPFEVEQFIITQTQQNVHEYDRESLAREWWQIQKFLPLSTAVHG